MDKTEEIRPNGSIITKVTTGRGNILYYVQDKNNEPSLNGPWYHLQNARKDADGELESKQ